ncbi:aspartate dehydrogenase [Pseudaminobacter arsenicus]|uniref:L-aspartate dehydrogenase n=1 Tax=Borborobacter arsenicus TaxID=1851146 RepID=A0A432UZU0_9HYPH|nr:aspartate dehydrogenase [Pseudaminobacter arsenicus]RUM95430.1 aspartate dehydrogenase [Pseudaminobacter arsenicus]
MRRPVAIIGFGGITRTLVSAIQPDAEDFEVKNILVRAGYLDNPDYRWGNARFISSIDELDADVELVIEAAGHSAVQQFALDVARSGRTLAIVSSGALADDDLRGELLMSARSHEASVHVVSGAIGALDALLTARAAGKQSVHYEGIKPTKAWRGTHAEQCVDLDKVEEPTSFFTGTARDVARLYPKNANVAATIALAANGFDETTVTLVADPGASHNRHVVESQNTLGGFRFEITSLPSADNPRTSGSTAFSILAYLRQGTNMVSL